MVLLFGLLLLYFLENFGLMNFTEKYINQVSELIAEISGRKNNQFRSNIF